MTGAAPERAAASGRLPARILVVDDERAVRESLAAVLEEAGHVVAQARDGCEAVRRFAEDRPDLVLIDAMMPRMDGFSACAKIRETDERAQIVFLTALGDDASQLRGLGAGADDYVAKTAAAPVLLARVAAALRRARAEEPTGDFDFGGWRVLAAQMAMRGCDGERRDLGDREIALLRMLAARPGEVFSRDCLITRLWGPKADVSDGLLSVVVHKLRAKLGRDGWLIRSSRGAGYSYAGFAPGGAA